MKATQKGFSVVEMLIVIVIVGLLGAVGWLAYTRQSKGKNAAPNTTNSEQTSTTQSTQGNTQSSSNNFLILADFNAKIPLNDKTSGLKLGSVSSSSYNEADKSVPIIAPQLDSVWKCEADLDGNFKGTIGMISITTQAKRSGPGEPLVSKKVGNYTFGFEQGGANCTDSSEYQQLVDAFKAQFEKIEAN